MIYICQLLVFGAENVVVYDMNDAKMTLPLQFMNYLFIHL